MKKIVTLFALALITGGVSAQCKSKKDMEGTWRYYQAVAYAPKVSNISRCEAAFRPDSATHGAFEGWCWISPGKGPKTQNMFGEYTIVNTNTCDVEVKMDMGAMGVSDFRFVLAMDHFSWAGQWNNQGGDWGVTNGVKILKSTETPVPPAN